MIYYPYVYSVGPNFRIFSRTWEYPSRSAHPRSQRVTLAALGSTRVEHCELALDLVGAQKITPSRLSYDFLGICSVPKLSSQRGTLSGHFPHNLDITSSGGLVFVFLLV